MFKSVVLGDPTLSAIKRPIKKQTLPLRNSLFLILLSLNLAASFAQENTPIPKPVTPEPKKSGFCELPLIRNIAYQWKNIRDRAAWGRPGISEIRNGQYEAYVARIRDSHDNRGAEIPSVYGPLNGFDPERGARLQQLSAENRNSITPSYFKSYEPDEKNTYPTLEAIWYRGEKETPTDAWQAAMKNVRGWLAAYENYEDILNKTVIEGFEAKIQAASLLKVLEKKRASDFQSVEVIRNGIEVLLPTLKWDEENHQIVKSEKLVRFLTYPELTSAYLSSVREFAETFGLPSNPLELLDARIATLKKIPWRQMINPLFWIFRVFNDTLGFSADSFTWLKSKVIAAGELQGVIDAQAYRRRRLELAHKVISNRRDTQKFPLNDEENALLKDLASALLDPKLAPRSDAIRREQAMEMRAEAWAYYGKKSRLSKLAGPKDFTTSLLGGQTPAVEPAKYLSLKDRLKPEIENNDQLSYFARLQDMFRRHKKLLTLGAITTSLTGVVLMQLDNFTTPLTDNPHIKYGQSYVGDHLNMIVAKYFDSRGSGNSVIRKAVKTSGKVWDIENPAIFSIVDAHLSRYRERYRIDPHYNFLSDPSFQKDLEIVFDKLLQVRKDYGVSALFAAGSDYLLKVGYQKAASEEIRASLKVQYPNDTFRIDAAFNILATNRYQMPNLIDLSPMRESSPDLYFDLRYFFENQFSNAVAQVRTFGVMFTATGDAYQSFAHAPQAFKNEIIALEKQKAADQAAAALATAKAAAKTPPAKSVRAKK